jgi:DNA adenine methylase
LWSEILERPESFADEYRQLWNAQLGQKREYFDQVRRLFNESQRPAHFLYLLARCVKAAVRYNRSGEFNNTPDNRRKGAHPDEMQQRIAGASQLLGRKTKTTALNYRDVLADCSPDDLIYLDPPYQGVGTVKDHRYAPKVCHGDFSDALADLNRRDCLYMVSYDGRTGEKRFGQPLPPSLGLVHLEIPAGRSSQATLLGRDAITYESLYLSPALAARIGGRQTSTLNRHKNRPVGGGCQPTGRGSAILTSQPTT